MSRDEREGQPRLSKEGIRERELEPFCPTLNKTGEEEARAVSGDPCGRLLSTQLSWSRGTGTRRSVFPARSGLLLLSEETGMNALPTKG